MIDYVKCLECSKEKSREDTFLDIPLPVRPFGSTVAYGSVVSTKTRKLWWPLYMLQVVRVQLGNVF